MPRPHRTRPLRPKLKIRIRPWQSRPPAVTFGTGVRSATGWRQDGQPAANSLADGQGELAPREQIAASPRCRDARRQNQTASVSCNSRGRATRPIHDQQGKHDIGQRGGWPARINTVSTAPPTAVGRPVRANTERNTGKGSESERRLKATGTGCNALPVVPMGMTNCLRSGGGVSGTS